MLREHSSKPLYEQIKEYILDNINTGEFKVNSRIPSERDLAEQFGVSRLTVNKALKELTQAGYLYTQIALEETTILASICPNILEKYDFSKTSLYTVLREKYGVAITYAEQSFEARAASKIEATHLELAAGDPLLSIHRVTYTQQDVPVEYVKSVYRGDRYKFRAILRRI